MPTMKTKILILSIALFLVITGVALANNGFDLSRWVVSGGGTNSGAGDVNLQATLGQPVVGVITGGDISLRQGYWHGNFWYSVYVPLIQRYSIGQ
jgi:hypothetical protein